MQTLPARRELERAVQRRDPSYDGIFFLSVRTTGIFCRPSCHSRRPLPRNVEYFRSAKEALFAGYRPCKRCRPLETDGRPPTWVKNLLRRVENDPTERIRDYDVRRMGIEPARARRFFQKHYGVTFQGYCRARRMGTALRQIREGADVLNVALGQGYQSVSGFRDAFGKTFGKTPGRSKESACVLTQMIESPLGALLAGATDKGVCLLEFTDRRALEAQVATLRKRFGCPLVPGKHAHLSELRRQLDLYFGGKLRDFDLKLTYPGTEFQQKVWSALLRIPYGKTWSYEQLAVAVGVPNGQRAVGLANGANRIAIVIPCHRVVNKSGKLGGYGGGLWRKQFLLDLERK